MANFPATSMTFVDAVKNGSISDPKVWEKYCERYYGPVALFVAERMSQSKYQRLKPYVDPEDVAHEALRKLWAILADGKYHRVEGKRFSAYCRTILINALNDFLDKACVRHEILDENEQAENEGEERPNTVFDLGGLDSNTLGQDACYAKIDNDMAAHKSFINATFKWAKKTFYKNSRMSEQTEVIVKKTVFEGVSVCETARELKMNPNTVSQIKSRFEKGARSYVMRTYCKDGVVIDADVFREIIERSAL